MYEILSTTDEKIYVCSNSCDQFMREVVKPIIIDLKLSDLEYLIYSGSDGESCIDMDKWAEVLRRAIFATPSVVYGPDSNNGYHVFGIYYYGTHFDAMDVI